MASRQQPSSTQKLAAEIRAWCAAHADPVNANRYARFFTEGYDAWGFLDSKHVFWTEMEPLWFHAHSGLGLPGFLKLGHELCLSGKFEEAGIAIRFLTHCPEPFDATSLPALALWFDGGIRNWAHTDVLCSLVLEPALLAGRISRHDLAPWLDSPHKFQRRAVPVALLKCTDPPQDLLTFITPLMHDPERFVQQGLGWFLRELWKRHPKPVEAFLLKHKDTAPRVIYQYATEKMTAEQKARFRRAKTKPAKSGKL
jgi:hypothetical protein